MSGSAGTVLVFYLNLFLLVGVLLRHFLKPLARFVPYTVLLLVLGVLLGVAAVPLEEELYGASNRTSSAGGHRRALAASSSSSGGGGSSSNHSAGAHGDVWWSPREDYVTAVRTVATLDPHTLLYVFLPALLFESAQAIDFHVFKKTIIKTTTLAFPGMFIGSMMMATVVKALYPNWTWDLCMLLGTITSATDPVAVVALLRELGAKVTLSTTIEGESLMNDGSAVVLFFVLKEIATYGGLGVPGYTDAPTIIWTFCRMALLGPLIGITFGYISLLWISRVFNDPLVEISISIFTAYLAFYVSEFWVHSSGVLTVVFVGLAFSSRGRTSISPEVFHFLHEFWETLGYVANTIIFLITGIAIAYNWPKDSFAGQNFGYAVAVYAAGLAIRFCLFTLTYPLFKRTPYGWTWKEALIASWGGLRGAVGLALGLLVLQEDPGDLVCPTDPDSVNLSCLEVRSIIMLHTSVMVVGTLLINAPLLKPLLKLLRFVELSHEELTMLAHVAERLKKDSLKEMRRIQDDPFLSNSNWETVRHYADLNELFRPLLKGMTVKDGHKKGSKDDQHRLSALSEAASVGGSQPSSPTHGEHGSFRDHTWRSSRVSTREAPIWDGPSHFEVPEVLSRASLRHSVRHSFAGGNDSFGGGNDSIPKGPSLDSLRSELKYHYHMSLKAGIWHLQHQGTLGTRATDILVDALNHKLDDKHAVDWLRWEELQSAAGLKLSFKPARWLTEARKIPFLGPLFTRLLSDRLQMWNDVAFGFLSVHQHLEHEVEHWSTEVELTSELHAVMHENEEGARLSLIHLQEVLPEVCLTVNTRQAARLMLNSTREKIQQLEGAGNLPEPQAKAMIAQVETQMRKLQLASMVFDISKERVLREVTWMSQLSADSFAVLLEACTTREYQKGEYLVRQGDIASGENESVFLVARGIVEIIEEYENDRESVVARRGSGVVIGEQSLLTGAPRAASARACTSVLAFGLPYTAMRRAFVQHPELADRLWHHVGKNLAQKLLGDAEAGENGGERKSTAEELMLQAEEWVPNVNAVALLEAGDVMEIEGKLLLLHGACIEFREGETPPTQPQLNELVLAVKREAEEGQRREAEAMKHAVRLRARGRRGSFQARFFGAADSGAVGAAAAAASSSSSINATLANANASAAASASASAASGGGGGETTVTPRQQQQQQTHLAAAAAAAAVAANASTAGERKASATSLAPPGGGGGKVVDLGRERRLLHQTSPWIVHLAPCLIDVPTGGALARHHIQMLAPCRMCTEPRHAAHSMTLTHHGHVDKHDWGMGEAAPATSNNHHANHITRANPTHLEVLEGAPLPLVCVPHRLGTSLAASMTKKLTTHRFAPGEQILTTPSSAMEGPTKGCGEGSIVFIISGQVACDVDPKPAAKEREGDDGGGGGGEGALGAGEPFHICDGKAKETDGGPVVLTPPAGAPFGEWLLLQPGLAQVPRIVAHSTTTLLSLTEHDLTVAMQADDNLATNFWWGRTQREAFIFLRKLEPYCWWQPSKLWRWLQYGKHVKIPEGKGQLAVQAAFVVLVHGRCHVMLQDGERGAMSGALADDGLRRKLGSMKLLGSGARIADLLNFQSFTNRAGSHTSGGTRPSSPIQTPTGLFQSTPSVTPSSLHQSAGGRWVPGPDIIHCHEEIAYHFARDSLVFIPGERGLQWIPQNYVFSTPSISGVGGAPLPPAYQAITSQRDRSGVGLPPPVDNDTLTA